MLPKPINGNPLLEDHTPTVSLLMKVVDSTSVFERIDPSRVLVICHDGDDVCNFGDFLGPLHFTYAINTPEAALFVASNL